MLTIIIPMDPVLASSEPKPVPVPRRIHDSGTKKPVPLPRGRPINDGAKFSAMDDARGEHINDTKDNPKSVTKTLKDEFKSASESVQERGKAVLEGTRIVSARFEKTVRSMMDKRRTGARNQPSPTKEKEAGTMQVAVSRSTSLPSQDIFQSISFQSPLDDHRADVDMERFPACEDDSSSDDDSIALPPLYPPPPLPDESVYDEVQSVVSSHSSNYDSYYCSSLSGSVADSETLYEDISMIRGQTSDLANSSNSVHFRGALRSDSWSFYDNAALDNLQSNVPGGNDIPGAGPLLPNVNEEGSLSAAFSGASSSVFDGLEALQRSIEDDIDEAFPADSPSTRYSSESVQNELYYLPNRELINAPQVSLRNSASEVKRKIPSKSVMLEFDPFYENVRDTKLTGNVDYEQMSLAQSLAPYGKIQKIVVADVYEETESGDEDTCPVIPPRRYDSIEPFSEAPTPANINLKAKPLPQAHPTVVRSEENLSVLPVIYPKKSQMNPTDLKVPSKPKRRFLPLQADLSVIPADKTCATTVPAAERASSVPKDDVAANKLRNTSLVRWSSMKKALRQVAEGSRRSTFKAAETVSESTIERPNVTNQMAVHSGVLYRAADGDRGRDFMQRYCVLAEGRLTFYADTSRSEVRDAISLSSILSIQLVLDRKVSTDGENLHCLELSVSWKNRSHMFGSTGSTERRVWMQKILESLTMVFPMRIACDFNRAGWCYMKEGISGEWKAAWILLNKRTLFYCFNNRPDTLQEIDLRKARCVELQDCDSNSPKVEEKGQLIGVDFPGQGLYLQMDLVRETLAWRSAIKAASVENGPNLSQQQLTRDDVPAIVDKCINFVFAHGSLSEGIYRRSGANSMVQRLLAQFRQDAWSVQLTRQEYSEFDVASVLKRFFRDLPESVLTTELHGQLCDIAEGKCGNDKLGFYRKTLEKLPPINFLTLRKLLGHLFFIHEQHEKTLMPIENLASIWGPTLMHIEGGAADSLDRTLVESSVVADLIGLYPLLFDVDAAELGREKRLQEALERLQHSNVRPNKPSGDLRVWVHVGSRDSKDCVNVTIGPQRTAGEVCSELSSRVSVPAYELCLEEAVGGGSLARPLHHKENVLSTVLRWGYWDDLDRKDNCLVLCKNTTLSEILPRVSLPAMISGELKFADQRSKNFKSYLFEFSQAKLCYYKDKSGSIKLGEWKIEDIVWYIGHEPKRTPHMRWAITFIDRNNCKKRSKENPYFGCTIAGSLKEDQIRWMTAMMVGEYQQDLVPHPVLIE